MARVRLSGLAIGGGREARRGESDPMPAEGPRQVLARLPHAPGVYRFRDAGGRVLYVGRAAQLRRRVASYWGDLRDRRHLTRMVPRIARIEAAVCESEHEAAWFERNLLENHLPRWNRIAGGTEVPVFIRLDGGPRSPGLTVVHEPRPLAGTRHFGPYLGGLKVRLAVSALARALPLAYTGDGMTGSEREMARVRGVGRQDRDTLVASLVAVLDRDPTALASVVDLLTRLRAEASTALAFELAGRLSAEVEAVCWVTAVQRATVAESVDVEFAGWAGGLLVCFGVRGGRLCTWTQRSCSRSAAEPRLAATPPAWAEFARRNAELAARLQG